MAHPEPAVPAAQEAVRHSARLVRLLTVLGGPGPAEELVQETLVALSEAFGAEVVCLVGADPGTERVVVTGACGLPEGHPGFAVGWPLCQTGQEVLRSGVPTWAVTGPDDPEMPVQLRAFGLRSVAWVPVTGRDAVGELVVLYRASGDAFSATDLSILAATAHRLGVSLASRERGRALERFALDGHRIALDLDLDVLLDEAAGLFADLTGASDVSVLWLDGDLLWLRAWRSPTGPGPGEPGGGEPSSTRWPCRAADLDAWPDLAEGRRWEGVERADDGTVAGVAYVPVPTPGGTTVVLRLAGYRPGSLAAVVEVATTFAVHLAVVLGNAVLYDALGRSEASLRLITDAISDLVAVVDSAGRFVYVSPSYLRGLGQDPQSWTGRRVVELVHPQERDAVLDALSRPGSTARVECRLASSDGAWVWVETALRVASPQEGTVVLSSRVIEERKRLEDELLTRETHDPLTGLANRALIARRIEAAFSTDDVPEIGVLFCDLDKFKAVNDRLGHEAGDVLLRQVAHRLGEAIRPTDMLARFGGDEFVVIMEGVRSLKDVDEIGHRLLHALAEPFHLAGESVPVSASIGGVLATENCRGNPGAMLRDADAAMYAAKDGGRGRVALFDDDDSLRSLDRWSLRADVVGALGRGEFVLHYQPIVDLASARTVALEALIRWRHPVRGLVPPDEFVPVLEETGAVVDIGLWVIGEACGRLATWRRLPGNAELSMHVNVSPVQLRDARFPQDVLEVLTRTGLPPRALWLEVTERDDLAAGTGDVIADLRARGVRCALDDFGMSRSNLEYLKRVRVDALKIDKSFVAGVTHDEVDAAIVRAVLGIAESMGMAVVAEGVETDEQREALQGLGCELAQGFFFSRPLPRGTVSGRIGGRPAGRAH